MNKSLVGEDEKTEKMEEDTSLKAKAAKEDSLQNSPSNTGDNEDIVEGEYTETESVRDESESIEEIKTAIETGNLDSKETENNSSDNSTSDVQALEASKAIGQAMEEKDDKTPIVENNADISAKEEVESSRTKKLELKLQELEAELRQEKELKLDKLYEEVAQKVKESTEAKTELKKVEPLVRQDESIENKNKEEKQSDWQDWDKAEKKENEDNAIKIEPTDNSPESKAEGFRKMGMAWSAGVAFFISVVFMLVLGWGADVLLGSGPWGIVVGIIIGALIGFIQLIRTTSQIFKPKPNDFDKVSLKSNLDAVEKAKLNERIEDKADKKPEENTAELNQKKDQVETLEQIEESAAEKIEERTIQTTIESPANTDVEAEITLENKLEEE